MIGDDEKNRIIKSDNVQFHRNLSNIQQQINSIRIHYFSNTQSPINDFLSDSLTDFGISFVKSSTGISKTRSRNFLSKFDKQRKNTINEKINKQINSVILELEKLLSEHSEVTLAFTNNSSRLIKKMNKINNAKQLQKNLDLKLTQL